MKSIKLVILLLSLCFSCYSQKKETIKIPEGIVYKYSNPKIVEKAKLLIQENLTNNSKYDLADTNLIIGPILWRRFKEYEKINTIEGGNVEFHVDNLVLKGKISKSIEDSKIIWDVFRDEIKSDFKIRKATEFELTYYWTVISFDIEEPLLIVETKEHNYILNLDPKGLKLFWLDEVPNNNKNFVQYRNGEEVKDIPKGEKETAIESITLLNTDEELRENTSVEDLTEIINETKKIFEDLFMNSDKSGKIMVHFELKKDTNEVNFAVKDDVDLILMKEFENRVLSLKLPKSKKESIQFKILFKINSFNETNEN